MIMVLLYNATLTDFISVQRQIIKTQAAVCKQSNLHYQTATQDTKQKSANFAWTENEKNNWKMWENLIFRVVVVVYYIVKKSILKVM